MPEDGDRLRVAVKAMQMDGVFSGNSKTSKVVRMALMGISVSEKG